ncbi:MAG: hypothetical protein IK020_06765 [Clostridiales bacterium]|nr:hypothetical protein [Clostridiales bacterium]
MSKMKNQVRKSFSDIGKKLSVFVLVLSFILALTGCVQFELSTTVNRDGTVDIHILYATIDLSSLSGDSDPSSSSVNVADANAETMKKLEEIGWKTKEYKANINGTDYVGFECAKNGINIDDVPSEVDKANEAGLGMKGFSLKKDGDKYVFDWDIASSNSDLESQGLDASTIAEYGGFMKVSLSVPNGTLKDNAMSVASDGTLEWDLFSCTESPHAEFTIDAGLVDDDDDDDDDKKGGKKDKDDDDDDEDEDDEVSGSKSKKSKKSKNSNSDDGMPVWVIGLIIGGSVLVVAAVVVIIIVAVKKKKNNGDVTA